MKRDIIRLTTGTRYVYFTSLYNEESPIYQKLGLNAADSLGSIASSLKKELTVDTNNQKVTTALSFLSQAAEYERSKEVQFFKNFKSEHKDIDKMFNINLDNPTDQDYINFIIDINKALKGASQFKKQLQSELKRIKRNIEFDKTGEYKALTQNKENERYIEQQVANCLNEELFFLKRGSNNGSKVFNDIFSKKTNFSEISDMIISQYGTQLFIFQGNSLKLDARKTNALIKSLTDYAYSLIIANFEGMSSNQQVRTQQIEEIILGPDFDNFFKQIMSSPYLEESLDDIAKQYGLNYGEGPDTRGQGTAVKNIKEKLKQHYYRIKGAMPKSNKEFTQWLKEQGLDDNALTELYKSTTTVKAQSYYTGEDINLMNLIANHISAALGGGSNPTDDIEAGALICTLSGTIDTKAIEASTAKIGRDVYDKIKSTSKLDDFISNTELLRQAREQQQQELTKALESIDESERGLNDLLSHINIHTTVKGYKSVGRNSFIRENGFKGAAFGANLIEQLNIIDEMSRNGIISLADVEDLQFLMVNAGAQMIGHDYKSTIENYFSIFVGFLMFNDAQLMFEDVSMWLKTNVISNVNDIHLYELNGVTVPTSYLLQNTYNALMQASNSINTGVKGTKAILHTYNKNPITGDWEGTLTAANAATKLEMRFLVGFLDILDQINDAMPG